MRCVHGPCIAALHVWVALIVPGCVHVCLRFAVGVGSSGVRMFHVLILMSILVLNCEVLWIRRYISVAYYYYCIAGTVVTRLLTAVRWAQAVTYRMILVIAGKVVTRLLTAVRWAQAVTYRMILVHCWDCCHQIADSSEMGTGCYI